MEILQNYDLSKLNTFGVPARAKFFVEVSNEAELKELFTNSLFKDNEKLFMGGGSNILFTKDFNGIVILNKLVGIELLNEGEKEVEIRTLGGTVWHDLVTYAVERGYWGIENLSLIPGTVGAAPMQNIGAYGAELKNVLESVEALDVDTGESRTFNTTECELGYRDSIFKNGLKGKYFIYAVTLRLSKIEQKNINYKILKDYLEKNQIEVKNSKDVSDAVSEIRRSKLPDPKIIGNAGSFFKNSFLDKEKLAELLKDYPEMPHFGEEGLIKVPSAWFIEQCGWKGKKVGSAGVHDKQALVLVNHGTATGIEIKKLAEDIINSVYSKFGVKLIPEVNFI
ncbi:UDP-N-acetylmuramate dehydrogenase [Patescibacteria group bacterium]|nr:UDP-N-acetylmuramate dehydrogenase [Patescibacteria group bacterium]